MTAAIASQCFACKHLDTSEMDEASGRPQLTRCSAFPGGIPDAMLLGGDHRQPIGGEDSGITFDLADNDDARRAYGWWSKVFADGGSGGKRAPSRVRRKHLPGEHNQDSHGNRGADLGILAGLSVMDADEYLKEYGTVVDERFIFDADETGFNLTARIFERGDAHVVIDLPGDRYQVMSEVDGAEGMRALSSDIRKMQHAKIPDGEPTGGVVASTESPEHGLHVAKDDLGGIWLRPDGAADDDYLELTEEEAWDFFDALEQAADSFEDEFNEDDDELEFLDEDEEEDEADEKSAPGKSASKGASMATTTRSRSMNTKTMQANGFRIKNADRGEFSAVLATLNVIDSDGDVTRPGAFDSSDFPLSAYGHKSWEGALPVGIGRVKEVGNEAILEGHFFMDTTHGRDTFLTVKRLGPLGQWSYGYDPVGHSNGMHEGKSVRFLEKLKVHEASPVLVGAGVGTRTLGTKGRSMTSSGRSRAVKGAIPCHETKTVSRAWDRVRTENALPDDARPSELRSVYAWVDPDGDPELKASYSFPHHHGIGGPANLRACLMGIASLNGPAGADMGDAERKGIYDHLAGHLKDADREPPALRDRGTGPTKQYDELSEGLAIISGLIDGAYSGAALRREKGRGLSGAKAELLTWMADDLTRLKSLLSNPVEPETAEPDDDEVASVFAASIALINGISPA